VGRKPIGRKAMTPAEKQRRYRQRNIKIADQVQRLVYLFSAQSEEARAAFVEWLRKTRRLK
jgi:hypothetical protein